MTDPQPAAPAPPSLEADALLNGLGFVLRLGLLPLAAAWVARSLGPLGQGQFGYAHGIAAVGAYFVLWGLAQTGTRFVARAMGAGSAVEVAAVVATTRSWLARSSLVVLALGLPLAAWLESGPERVLVLVAVPYAVLIAWFAWRAGIGVGLRRYDILLFGHVLYMTALFLGLWLGLGSAQPVLGALLAYGTARLVHLLFLQWALARVLHRLVSDEAGEGVGDVRIRVSEAQTALRPELLGFAAQMAGVVVTSTVLWERSEVLFLRALSTPEMLGYYTAAVALAIMVFRVPGLLSVVLLPVVAGLEGSKAAPEEVGRLVRKGCLALCWLVSPPVAVGIVLVVPGIEILYGPNFAPSAPILAVLLLPVLLAGAETVCARTLVGAGRQGVLLRWNAATALLNLCLCGVLVGAHGGLGAAYACATALAVQILGVTTLGLRAFPAPGTVPARAWLLLLCVTLAAAGTAASVLRAWPSDGSLSLGANLALASGLGVWGASLAALRFAPLRLDQEPGKAADGS